MGKNRKKFDLGVEKNLSTIHKYRPERYTTEKTQPTLTTMSALAFTNSIDFQDASKCRQFLIDKGVDIPEGMTDALPVQAFHGFFTQEAIFQWDREATEAELRQKAEKEWEVYKSRTPEADPKVKAEMTNGALWVKTRGQFGLYINNPQLIVDVCDFLQGKQIEVVEARYKQLKPPSHSKATGKRAAKRDNSEFELDVKNTPETAQGLKDYNYYLPADESAVFLKDGKIKKVFDGGKDIKPQTYKAVRKEKPFLTEGGCCGGITWDRAAGSECLKDLGIKGAFVMGCSNHPVEGSDFCIKCEGKKSSVFETCYKSGKYKDYTYAQVLWELHQKNGKVLDGDGAWIEGKCSKWINTYQ